MQQFQTRFDNRSYSSHPSPLKMAGQIYSGFGESEIFEKNVFMSTTSHKHHQVTSARWQGGSDQFYPVIEVCVSDFVLNENRLYMLVANGRPLWVGTSRDLIESSTSRAQFKSAVSFASTAYEMELPHAEADRIHLVADLLNGRPADCRHAA